jgi:hypothetical protein
MMRDALIFVAGGAVVAAFVVGWFWAGAIIALAAGYEI